MADIELVVRGQVYSGWTSLTVTRSMEALAPDFALSVAEAWSQAATPIPIAAGDAVEVRYRGDPVYAGWIDVDELAYDATSHVLTLEGRAKTEDLVDCSAKHASGEWSNVGLLQIARDLGRPFGISVSSEADLGAPFDKFALQEGESVHEALERAGRMRGVLLMTDRAGDLVLTRATSSRRTATVIEAGRNALRGRRRTDLRDRYRTYTVKSQVPGRDTFYGPHAAEPSAQATDSGIRRYRPLTLLAESQETAELTKRATWERNVRAGRSQRLSYTVPGWENAEGLWTPNVLVPVKDRLARVDGELLVVSVALRRDDEGQVTDLELTDRRAMTVEPLSPSPDREQSYP